MSSPRRAPTSCSAGSSRTSAPPLPSVSRPHGPGSATFIRCDVTRHEDREALLAQTLARHGRLDCLINNAGSHPPHRPIDVFSLDDFRAILELNVISPFALCKAALPHLRQSRGSIVNVASLVATIGQLHATTYVATKGAVLAFTKALAIDEAPHVRVNSVSPGNVFTPLWQEAIDASPDPAATRQAGEEAQPFGRMGTPREVGLLCLYLAADATFTTGVDHVISGGRSWGMGGRPGERLNRIVDRLLSTGAPISSRAYGRSSARFTGV